VIAAPWRTIAPAAVPDAALIEGSRFFRLEDAMTVPRRPEAFTPWWPFIVCSLVTYGVLPRLILWTIATVKLRSATRALLLEDARVAALLDPGPGTRRGSRGIARCGKTGRAHTLVYRWQRPPS
jgi:hypothetical protein